MSKPLFGEHMLDIGTMSLSRGLAMSDVEFLVALVVNHVQFNPSLSKADALSDMVLWTP
jgi:hypothetical protein